MKLESTLPERPGFLHAIPVLNLLALLLVFILLGPSFVSQSGVALELPVSRFQMERNAETTVVSVTSGDPPRYWLERESVTLPQLAERLEARRGGQDVPATTVLLNVDRNVSVEVQREVAEIALQKGFRVNLIGQPAAAGEAQDRSGE